MYVGTGSLGNSAELQTSLSRLYRGLHWDPALDFVP